jgi:hypothetical protein
LPRRGLQALARAARVADGLRLFSGSRCDESSRAMVFAVL